MPSTQETQPWKSVWPAEETASNQAATIPKDLSEEELTNKRAYGTHASNSKGRIVHIEKKKVVEKKCKSVHGGIGKVIDENRIEPRANSSVLELATRLWWNSLFWTWEMFSWFRRWRGGGKGRGWGSMEPEYKCKQLISIIPSERESKRSSSSEVRCILSNWVNSVRGLEIN